MRRWWHKILYIALESILALFKATFMNKTITALLAGIVIGILIAPDKGSETVRKLRSRVNDYKDQAADKAAEFASKGKEAFQNGRDQLSEELD
jgi:gas vesicle protein